MINGMYLSNKYGIPRIATSALTVGTTEVDLTVPSNSFFNSTFNGLILFKFVQPMPTGTTTTLPIVLSSNAGTKAMTVAGGDELTVADYTTGIHLAYYESNTGILQLIA